MSEEQRRQLLVSRTGGLNTLSYKAPFFVYFGRLILLKVVELHQLMAGTCINKWICLLVIFCSGGRPGLSPHFPFDVGGIVPPLGPPKSRPKRFRTVGL